MILISIKKIAKKPAKIKYMIKVSTPDIALPTNPILLPLESHSDGNGDKNPT